MDSSEFRAAAHQMIDYVIDYLENIRERLVSQLNIETKKKKVTYSLVCIYDVMNVYLWHKRRVVPTVKPGYLRELIPDSAPETGEPWEAIYQDIERVITPGVSNLTINNAANSFILFCFLYLGH